MVEWVAAVVNTEIVETYIICIDIIPYTGIKNITSIIVFSFSSNLIGYSENKNILTLGNIYNNSLYLISFIGKFNTYNKIQQTLYRVT